MSFDTCS